MRLIRALKEATVLIGDGANGTCLAARGFTRQPYDLANVLAPDLVLAVHQDYFDAGSMAVETNTFEANRVRLADYDFNIRDLNVRGAQIARQAYARARASHMAIAGSHASSSPMGSPLARHTPLTTR